MTNVTYFLKNIIFFSCNIIVLNISQNTRNSVSDILNTAPPWAEVRLGAADGDRALRRVHRLGGGPGGVPHVQNRRF